MDELIIYEVLKTPVVEWNPFIYEMPVAGDHIWVYQVLNKVFLDNKMIFVGDIEQLVEGVSEHMSEYRVREALRELERYGFLELEDGKFRPTQQYIDKFR